MGPRWAFLLVPLGKTSLPRGTWVNWFYCVWVTGWELQRDPLAEAEPVWGPQTHWPDIFCIFTFKVHSRSVMFLLTFSCTFWSFALEQMDGNSSFYAFGLFQKRAHEPKRGWKHCWMSCLFLTKGTKIETQIHIVLFFFLTFSQNPLDIWMETKSIFLW